MAEYLTISVFLKVVVYVGVLVVVAWIFNRWEKNRRRERRELAYRLHELEIAVVHLQFPNETSEHWGKVFEFNEKLRREALDEDERKYP